MVPCSAVESGKITIVGVGVGLGLRLKERRLVGEVVDIATVNSSLGRSPLISLPAVFWMSRKAPPFLVRPKKRLQCALV